MSNLAGFKEKGKLFTASKKGKDALTVGIIVLVGGCSFFLGALSEREKAGNAPLAISNSLAPYKLEHAIDTSASIAPTASTTGSFVTSKNGTKYYPPGCSTSRIKDENKVYFTTAQEAEAAGYSKSGTCN